MTDGSTVYGINGDIVTNCISVVVAIFVKSSAPSYNNTFTFELVTST